MSGRGCGAARAGEQPGSFLLSSSPVSGACVVSMGFIKTTLHHAVLDYTVLYFIILHYIILYYKLIGVTIGLNLVSEGP